MHWASRSKYYEDWYWLVSSEVAFKRPQMPYSRVLVTFTRLGIKLMDFDGLVGSLKPIMDGLVKAGVLIDDAWGVTGPWVVHQEKCKRGEEKIYVNVKLV